MIAGFFRKKKIKSGIYTFTEDTQFRIPSYVKSVDVFAVGGGGGGSNRDSKANHSGGGGSGGQVIHQSFTALAGELINISIGARGDGAPAGVQINGSDGGDTKFGSYVTAKGGLGGYYGTTNLAPTVENSVKGADGSYMGNGFNGLNGVVCPFEEDLEMYGASGGSGSAPYSGYTVGGVGGSTGGGNGGGGENNEPENAGGDAFFYGSGGGGAAFSSGQEYCSGGHGFQGILKIRLNI